MPSKSRKAKSRKHRTDKKRAAVRVSPSWSESSEMLCSESGAEGPPVPDLPVPDAPTSTSLDDALDDDFFTQPFLLQRVRAKTVEDSFEDLAPPRRVLVTPRLAARRRRLRGVVLGVVGAAALILTLGIANNGLGQHNGATYALSQP